LVPDQGSTVGAPGGDRLSVIIPTLNEAAHLPATLATVWGGGSESMTPEGIGPEGIGPEVIVVDGGSQDATCAIAAAAGARVISSPPGRCHQLNAGAAAATGRWLLFLHADTRLPPAYGVHLRHTLAQPGVVAGAFELAIDGPGWGLRWVEWGVQQRSRWLQRPYGDQGLFMARATFEGVGGFPVLPILEDVELVKALQQRGRIAIAPAAVVTAARRWQRLGVARTTVINQGILLGHRLGVDPHTLARWYRQWRSG